MAKYKRILLKLSGESLMGEKQYGIDEKRLAEYAQQIKEIHEQGVQIGIVIGGGNIFRGLSGANKGFDRVKGDQMGMLATVINSLALSSALVATGVKARVLTAVRMEPIGEFYSKWKAIECMERAFRLDTTDARILMELDQLYKRVRRSHKERLAFLQQYPELIKQRDDLILEEITLLNQTGEYEKAKTVLDAHNFHPWEGGEGKVPAQYQLARVELAKKALTAGENKEAISLLEECLEYPHHLGEGKLYGAQENDFYYFLGCAYEGLGQHDKAVECWEQAIIGPTEPAAAMYYNDAKPDKIFYQGLALLKLGRMDEANGRFHKLTSYGEKHLFDKIKMDYFAVSLPDLLIWEDDLTIRNVIHCKYMMALGYWGLNRKEKSLRLLSEVERLDINHQGIQAFRSLIG
mgnify:CR=1 FL=1